MRYTFKRIMGWGVIIAINTIGLYIVIKIAIILGEHIAKNFNYYKYLIIN